MEARESSRQRRRIWIKETGIKVERVGFGYVEALYCVQRGSRTMYSLKIFNRGTMHGLIPVQPAMGPSPVISQPPKPFQ